MEGGGHSKNPRPHGRPPNGETTSLLQFGRTSYEDVVRIDFVKRPHMRAAFDNDLSPKTAIGNLEAFIKRDTKPGATLLFLDEVQECAHAMTALKYFCQDLPSLDVVAAGKLLGVHVARSTSFPVGYVDMRTLHPMDFEDFCWVLCEERAFHLVRTSLQSLSP